MPSETKERARVPVTVVAGRCERARWGIAEALASGDGVVVSAAAPPGPVAPRVVTVDEEIFWTNPRCPCCAVRFDLLSVVPVLARSHRAPRRIVVAAGHDTDLAIIAQTLLADSEVERVAELDAFVAVVDAPEASARLATGNPLAPSANAADQLALADHVVVVRADRLTEEALAGLSSTLRRRYPLCALWLADPHDLDTTLLTGARSFDLRTVAARAISLAPPAPAGDAGHPSTVAIDLDGALDADLLLEWLDRMVEHHGHDLLRLRAVFRVHGWPTRRVCSGVRTCIGWGDEDASARVGSGSRVVLVGRGIDAGLVRCWLAEALA